jgi:cytochrome c-type biogenesis protein
LPLIPVYLSFLSGLSFDQLQRTTSAGTRLKKVFANTLLFVLGFSTVFIALGLVATGLGAFFNRYRVQIGFGAAVIILVLALHFMGAFQLRFLQYERRFDIGPKKKIGPVSSFLFGLAFAFGWTPCIGPILASVLLIAANQPGHGFWLLATYAAGLAIPFLLTALFFNTFMGLLNRVKRHMETVELLIGSILVIAAAYLVFNPFHVPLWIPLLATTGAMALVIVLKLAAKIPVRWPALFVAVTLLAAGGFVLVQETGASNIEQFGWTDASGRPADLSVYEGKVLVLQFFASWCGPCKEEIPKLAKIWREHQNEGFAIIGVNVDTERADGTAFVQTAGIPYPVVYGKSSNLAALGLREAFPNNVIVDAYDRAKVLANFTGWPGENELLAKIKSVVH